MENIFKRFYRVDRSRGEITGTGLGLSICQNIVQMYGGTISVENRPEGGAAFTLDLPPSDTPFVAAPDKPEPARQTQATRPARVLVIEDEVALANLVAIYLRGQGHEVVTRNDGTAGLETGLTQDFDLIICDLQLPGMTGDALLPELLRQRPELNGSVVIEKIPSSARFQSFQ